MGSASSNTWTELRASAVEHNQVSTAHAVTNLDEFKIEDRRLRSLGLRFGPSFLYWPPDFRPRLPPDHTDEEHHMCVWMRIFLLYAYKTHKHGADKIINITLSNADILRPLQAPPLDSWQDVLEFVREVNALIDKRFFEQLFCRKEYIQPLLDRLRRRDMLLQKLLKLADSESELDDFCTVSTYISLVPSKHTGSLPRVLSNVLHATEIFFQADYGNDGLSPAYHQAYNMSEADVDSWCYQKSCIPRKGEIVLFVRSLEMYQRILLVTDYDWEAGIVVRVSPCAQIITVVPCEDPQFGPHAINDAATIHVEHTRPYFLYAEICNIAKLPLHFGNATMYSTGISSHYPLKIYGGKTHDIKTKELGVTAIVNVKAMGLGAEMFRLGDVVRVLPSRQNDPITQVLHIGAIQFYYTRLQDWTTQWDQCQVAPRLIGNLYTIDRRKAASAVIDNSKLPRVMHPYGPWYRASEEIDTIYVCRAISRLYEKAYLAYLFHPTGLDCGRQAILDARTMPGAPRSPRGPCWQTLQPKSMHGPQGWYMANNRADALSMQTLDHPESKHVSEKAIYGIYVESTGGAENSLGSDSDGQSTVVGEQPSLGKDTTGQKHDSAITSPEEAEMD